MKLIDSLLNKITMYRVVLYGLVTLAGISILFGLLELLPFSGLQFLILLTLVLGSSYIFHKIFSLIFRSTTNNESFLISAFILYFLLSPISQRGDYIITLLASLLVVASKYVFAINKKHIFNPVAISVFILGFLGFGNTIWWIGSTNLLPFVLIIGLLIVRKLRVFHLFLSFLFFSIATISLNKVSPLEVITSWPIIFMGTVMLTEPLTKPNTRFNSIIYGGIVGIFFGSQFSFGPLFSSPELSLLIGNIFSFLVNPKFKLFLKLKSKIQLAPNIFEFQFNRPINFKFIPGQYLEWTLPHKNIDSRGNRRFFTISSSPTESELKLGIKMNENSSSFKKTLLELKNFNIIATNLSGEFILPNDKTEKLVFIAGGIGITPFRSIIKYLTDIKEKRNIVLFYVCSKRYEFVYKDIFANAQKAIDLKVIYIITHKEEAPSNWSGEIGYLNNEMIAKYAPDWKSRRFYLSGPNSMVESYSHLLKQLGVARNKIVKDYFPGF